MYNLKSFLKINVMCCFLINPFYSCFNNFLEMSTNCFSCLKTNFASSKEPANNINVSVNVGTMSNCGQDQGTDIRNFHHENFINNNDIPMNDVQNGLSDEDINVVRQHLTVKMRSGDDLGLMNRDLLFPEDSIHKTKSNSIYIEDRKDILGSVFCNDQEKYSSKSLNKFLCENHSGEVFSNNLLNYLSRNTKKNAHKIRVAKNLILFYNVFSPNADRYAKDNKLLPKIKISKNIVEKVKEYANDQECPDFRESINCMKILYSYFTKEQFDILLELGFEQDIEQFVRTINIILDVFYNVRHKCTPSPASYEHVLLKDDDIHKLCYGDLVDFSIRDTLQRFSTAESSKMSLDEEDKDIIRKTSTSFFTKNNKERSFESEDSSSLSLSSSSSSEKME